MSTYLGAAAAGNGGARGAARGAGSASSGTQVPAKQEQQRPWHAQQSRQPGQDAGAVPRAARDDDGQGRPWQQQQPQQAGGGQRQGPSRKKRGGPPVQNPGTWYCGGLLGCGYRHNSLASERCQACYLPWQSCFGQARRKARPARGAKGGGLPPGVDPGDIHDEDYDFFWPAPPVVSSPSPSPSPQRGGTKEEQAEELKQHRAQREAQAELEKLKQVHAALVPILGNEDRRVVEAKQAVDAAVERLRSAKPIHKQLEIASRRLHQARTRIDRARFNVETAEQTLARAQECLAERRGALQELLDTEAELRMEHKRMVSLAAAEGTLPAGFEPSLTEDGYEDVAIPTQWWEGLGIPTGGLPAGARTPEMLQLMRVLQETAVAIRTRVNTPEEELAAEAVGLAGAGHGVPAPLTPRPPPPSAAGAGSTGGPLPGPGPPVDAIYVPDDDMEQDTWEAPQGLLHTQDYHEGVAAAHAVNDRLKARDGPVDAAARQAQAAVAEHRKCAKREPLLAVKEEEPEAVRRRPPRSPSPRGRDEGAAAAAAAEPVGVGQSG